MWALIVLLTLASKYGAVKYDNEQGERRTRLDILTIKHVGNKN